jgi:hypothetical protein
MFALKTTSPSDTPQSASECNRILSDLWQLVERLDPQTAPLERYMTINVYLQMLSFYFRQILLSTPMFRTLRTEIT